MERRSFMSHALLGSIVAGIGLLGKSATAADHPDITDPNILAREVDFFEDDALHKVFETPCTQCGKTPWLTWAATRYVPRCACRIW